MGFSGETLFKEISFSVDEKDKIGIIGAMELEINTLKAAIENPNFTSFLKTPFSKTALFPFICFINNHLLLFYYFSIYGSLKKKLP